MSEIIDDLEAGRELAFEEARKLLELDPKHELLRLFPPKGRPDEKFAVILEEFQTRFGKPGISKEERATVYGQAYFWAEYYLALKRVVEQLQPS